MTRTTTTRRVATLVAGCFAALALTLSGCGDDGAATRNSGSTSGSGSGSGSASH